MVVSGRKGGAGAWVAVGIVLGLIIAANVALSVFRDVADRYLGARALVTRPPAGGEGWDAQYYRGASGTEVARARVALAARIAEEGVILLKNNGVLPLQMATEDTITVLGRAAAAPVYGGSVPGEDVVTLDSGLRKAGFTINPDVWGLLADYAAATEAAEDAAFYRNVLPSFATYSGAALVVIGRGEDSDATGLCREEREVLALATEHFDHVVVLVNAGMPVELGALQDDPAVDAIVWAGLPGNSGFLAVGRVLNGQVNPSGRTADIYPADFSAGPSAAYRSGTEDGTVAAQYGEGVYVGYRYYETAAAEGALPYDDAVVYPFGYGLSYTTFDWKVVESRLGGLDGRVAIDVRVTNTGAVPGRDVVELYYSPPYLRGGIEKSSINLADFAKTRLLRPGEEEVLTLSVAVEDMASYDPAGHRAYVLEAGDYELRVQRDSHTVADGCGTVVYPVAATVVYDARRPRASDRRAAVNRFDALSAGCARTVSRADFGAPAPAAPAAADVARAHAAAGVTDEPEAAPAPVFKARNGLGVIDMRGRAADDPQWEALLDQAARGDVVRLVTDGAEHSAAVPSLGLPARAAGGGPQGAGVVATYPGASVVAATYNVALARELGALVGEEALLRGLDGWYAPAMNVRRTPGAARTCGCYSEDPLLSGRMGAAVVSGAGERGLVAFVARLGLDGPEAGGGLWADEQTLREVYLRPFEICVKTATASLRYIADGTVAEVDVPACRAVLLSGARLGDVWTCGCGALLQDVLRGEWGFEGMVCADGVPDGSLSLGQCLRSGTDVLAVPGVLRRLENPSDPAALRDARVAARHVCEAAAHSAVMNGHVPGERVLFRLARWEVARIIVDVVLGALLAVWCVYIIMETRR